MDNRQLSYPTCHLLALPPELRIRIHKYLYESANPNSYCNAIMFNAIVVGP